MAEKIILRLTRGMDIGEEEIEVITYGLDCVLSKGIGLLLPMPIVLFLGLWKEYFLFCILFNLLRPQAGGYHADTRTRCTVISFILMSMSVIGIKVWELYWQEERTWLFLVPILLEIGICIMAPVDTENKRLTQKEKKYYKKKVICLLLILNLILAVCIYFKIVFYAYVMIQVLICQMLLLLVGRMKNRLITQE